MTENKTKAKPEAKGDAAKTATDAKTEGGAETPAAASAPSKKHHRGETQKPVTPSYRGNWNAIFGAKRR